MNVKRLSVPIFVVFVLCTSVSTAGAVDCTCGDICVSTTGWWRAGGMFNASGTPIQAAVDFAAEGDTVCVKDGTYTENVEVTKQLTIRSENGAGKTIVRTANTNDHVFTVTASRVNISGFTVTGASSGSNMGNTGIHLLNAQYCNISGNNVSNNYGARASPSMVTVATTPLPATRSATTTGTASTSVIAVATTPLPATRSATTGWVSPFMVTAAATPLPATRSATTTGTVSTYGIPAIIIL